jgi:hypothetical protein
MIRVRIAIMAFCVLFFSYQPASGQESRKDFTYKILMDLKEGTVRPSSASYKLIDIGNYSMALQLNEVPLQWGVDTLELKEQISIISPESWTQTISDSSRIVIVSEAHHKPQHRIFTKRILKGLYEKGFRYFGLEALTPNPDNDLILLDATLNQRKYPLDSPLTGRYAMEPQMGDLIREALDLGFVIFGYERFNKDQERDLAQAMNIKTIMESDPNGKYLIHCGWYHAIEDDTPKRKSDNYMAYHLKRLTGQDPITIYQDFLSEKYLYPECPIYDQINAQSMGVAVNSQGLPMRFTSHFDINVFHPRTTFQDGRPSYLTSQVRYFPLTIDMSDYDGTYPLIIEARISGEDNGTPLDRMELLHPTQTPILYLPFGAFKITIYDDQGNEREIEIQHQ